ncbi:hypothetical protein I302_107028 [Kwoniella bestiolae CBS 10118]|uniref:Uncharacterized protein n=1 Tax=Kwoniella bestiolae CBS 10118 TaxID=1296100 RepID=A0A1B9FZQ3_9TREE|nr:hypothetical protein I302_05707 [Kwoniella bestiolae CBS 10118]OCF24248.1 hypothetical protein I302_05707 [Kwoniella bestiolae CBS 10118]
MIFIEDESPASSPPTYDDSVAPPYTRPNDSPEALALTSTTAPTSVQAETGGGQSYLVTFSDKGSRAAAAAALEKLNSHADKQENFTWRVHNLESAEIDPLNTSLPIRLNLSGHSVHLPVQLQSVNTCGSGSECPSSTPLLTRMAEHQIFLTAPFDCPRNRSITGVLLTGLEESIKNDTQIQDWIRRTQFNLTVTGRRLFDGLSVPGDLLEKQITGTGLKLYAGEEVEKPFVTVSVTIEAQTLIFDERTRAPCAEGSHEDLPDSNIMKGEDVQSDRTSSENGPPNTTPICQSVNQSELFSGEDGTMITSEVDDEGVDL